MKKISLAEPSLGEEELDNVVDAIKSGWISSLGDFIQEFEEKFAKYCGMKYGIATSNGTAALHLALRAVGVGNNCEVIVPALTFVATANAVTYCNAKAVFADVNRDYWCMEPDGLEDIITDKTKAIIPVHIYGHPCDMDKILGFAEENNLYVIEDAAEAHGAEYKGKKVGSFGDISCFSFYANKIITTGEGGICLTDDEDLADELRLLRDHGMRKDRRYWHDIIGFNYRMTNMQAALGVAQIDKIDKLIRQKRQVANWYMKGLKKLEENKLVKLHPEMPWAKCVYWMYSILVEDKLGISRDNLIELFEINGIETRPFFYPLNILPPYKNDLTFSNAKELSGKGINLPSGPNLKYDDIEKILSVMDRVNETNIL